MTVYVTDDGLRFEANRSRTVVKTLRSESFGGPGGSKKSWMRTVAQRTKEGTGQRVRANNEVNFVRDLLKVGLLKKEITNG